MDLHEISMNCSLTEFVGTGKLDTIALVIGGIDPQLHQAMGIPEHYHALGLFSSRTGAAGQITAVDDAVKATNTSVLEIHLPRDTKGWGGHGNYIVVGGENVAEARRCMEIALEKADRNAGELYISKAGHLEFSYSARAGEALHKAFDAPPDQPFGFLCGSPAAIGLVMADRAMKSADVSIVKYMNPSVGTSHSNEVILVVTGDASAVKEAVLTAREIGLKLLISLGSYPDIPGTPFL